MLPHDSDGTMALHVEHAADVAGGAKIAATDFAAGRTT